MIIVTAISAVITAVVLYFAGLWLVDELRSLRISVEHLHKERYAMRERISALEAKAGGLK